MKHLIPLLILLISLTGCTLEQTNIDQETITPTEELATIAPTEEPTPLPEDITDEQAIVAEIETLTTRREAELLSTPGWLYIPVHHYSNEDLGTLPNGQTIPTDRLDESWYLLDDSGMVTTAITIMNNREGQPVQVSTIQDGIGRNLTLGIEETAQPFRPWLDMGFLQDTIRSLEQNRSIQRAEITLGDGRPGVQYTLYDASMIAGQESIEQEATFDLESGALLGLATYLMRDGERELLWQNIILGEQRMEQPYTDVLAYLEQEVSAYQPAPPQGIPAPSGYDPSNSSLQFTFVNGDDPDQPSFFFVDIYAGKYLLGRVDFGAVPSGYCDRSSDGRRLAFNYVKIDEDYSGHAVLHWYSLIDRQAFAPLPTLELLSPVTWASDSIHLAFSASPSSDYEQRALYVYNTNTGELTRLAQEAAGPWHPLWSPDGKYVISLTSPDSAGQLYVIDYRTGEIFYQGSFNYDSWEAAPDSPTHEWNIVFPRGIKGFERCE